MLSTQYRLRLEFICKCIVTPERIEQRERIELEKQQESEDDEIILPTEQIMGPTWEPSETSNMPNPYGQETTDFCTSKCSGYSGLGHINYDVPLGWFFCGCNYIGSGGYDQAYDYETKMKLNPSERQRRRDISEDYYKQLCEPKCQELLEDPEFPRATDQGIYVNSEGICECNEGIDNGMVRNLGKVPLFE